MGFNYMKSSMLIIFMTLLVSSLAQAQFLSVEDKLSMGVKELAERKRNLDANGQLYCKGGEGLCSTEADSLAKKGLTEHGASLLDDACNLMVEKVASPLNHGEDMSMDKVLEAETSPASLGFLKGFENAKKIFLKDCRPEHTRLIDESIEAAAEASFPGVIGRRMKTAKINQTASECFADFKDDEDKQKKLKEICLDQVKAVAFTPSEGMNALVAENINAETADSRAIAAIGSETKASYMPNAFSFSSPLMSTCTDKKNCVFTSDDNEKDCNLLDCTLAGGETFVEDAAFTDLFDHFAIRTESFEYAGNKSFCNNCLKKVYEQVKAPGEKRPFDDSKNAMKAKLQDNIAGKVAAKKIMNWIGHLETLKNFEYLNPSQKLGPESSCREEIEPLIAGGTNPCEGIPDERFRSRLGKALEVAKLPGTNDFDQFLRVVDGKVDPHSEMIPRMGRNSCRKVHALTNKMTMNNVENKGFKDALDYLVSSSDSNPEIAKLLSDENCSKGEYPQEAFVDLYAQNLADRYVRAYRQLNAGGGEATKEEICADDPVLGAVICGEAGGDKAMSPHAGSFFAEMSKDLHESIEVYSHRMNPVFSESGPLFGDPEKRFEREFNVRLFAENRFKKFVESIFHVSMGFDPAYKVAFGDWSNICEVRKLAKENGTSVLEAIDSKNGIHLDKQANRYSSAACGKLKEDLSSALCGDYPVLTDIDKGLLNTLPFSLKDLETAREEEFQNLNEYERVAANSLSCEMNSEKKNKSSRYFSSPLSVTELGKGMPSKLSDYEQKLAFAGSGEKPRLQEIVEGTDCKSDYAEFIAAAQGDSPESLGENVSVDDAIKHQKDVLKKKEVSFNSSLTDGVIEELDNPYAVPELEEELYGQSVAKGLEDVLPATAAGTSSKKGGAKGASQENSFNEGMGIGNLKVAGVDVDGKRAPASESFEPEEPSSKISELDSNNKGGVQKVDESLENVETPPEEPSQFKNLFGYINDPVDSGATGADAGIAKNFYPKASDYAVEEKEEEKVCDKRCLEELAVKDSKSIKPEEAAAKAGIEGFQGSSQEMREMFSDVLDGKLNNRDLETLKEENKKLREEMASIRETLKDRSKPSKVLDSNGVDRTESVSQPELNPNVVYNPRNNEVNEFRSRSYFDDKKDQFSPNFNESGSPERLSLGSYSAQRRSSAARIPQEHVKRYNADIDKTFLQSHSNSAVDDTFVKQYVDHVGQNSGSIEHLIVYENGRPARIRVPDPKNPGVYIEQKIAEDMVDEILEKVEKDEIESFALFNMVNFGQSLEEFVQDLEKEETNLTTLGSLNQSLEQMRDMEN